MTPWDMQLAQALSISLPTLWTVAGCVLFLVGMRVAVFRRNVPRYTWLGAIAFYAAGMLLGSAATWNAWEEITRDHLWSDMVREAESGD